MGRDFERLTEAERRLLECYRALNSDGRESLLKQARWHATSPDFKRRWAVDADGVAHILTDATEGDRQS